MKPPSTTVRLLTEMHRQIAGMDQRIERMDQRMERMDQRIERGDERMERVERRLVHGELRVATALTGLAGAVAEVRDMLGARRSERDQVADLDRRVTRLEEKIG